MSDDASEAGLELISGPSVELGVAWIGSRLKTVSYSVIDGKAVVEGCIILGSPDELRELTARAAAYEQGVEAYGAVIVGPKYRWLNKTVPYTIAAGFVGEERVHAAIAHWEQHTPIRFVPRTSQNRSFYPDYVTFRRVASGCGSRVGCQGKEQFVDLADGCQVGNVIHEIGHTVGLWHEQSRIDREDWVQLDLTTVPANMRHNFLQRIRDGQDVGDYDYASIMHYPSTAFSSNGSVTIRIKKPADPAAARMGQRDGLSPGDIATVKAIYAWA